MHEPHLSNGRQRFFQMVERYPQISLFWSRDTNGLDTQALDSAMEHMPGKDQVMCLFFLSVWNNRSHTELDLIAAMKSLDDERSKLIQEWFADPFWP